MSVASNLVIISMLAREGDQSELESATDFLIKLGMKPLMHLVEIRLFSLNNAIVRLTKIMNRADKNWAHF